MPPELDLGLSVTQTALRPGTEQEDPSQHAGRGASPVRADPAGLQALPGLISGYFG